MSVGYNDAVLLLSLLYSCADLQYEWENFDSCARPVHHWLVVSYACVIVFRLVHLLGAHLRDASNADSQASGSSGSEFLLELRQKHTLPRLLTLFTWLVAVPFFTAWTAVGTSWLWQVRRDTPDCMPTGTHMLFAGFWLALCYVWIFIHLALGGVAAALEHRVRRAEGDLRELEDDDTLSRWGQVSQMAGYSSLSSNGGPCGCGLKPSQIRALPEMELAADEEKAAADCNECSICITGLEPGDRVRRLPACGHAFHKPCIDLWLLRRAECPLCKRPVVGSATATGDFGC